MVDEDKKNQLKETTKKILQRLTDNEKKGLRERLGIGTDKEIDLEKIGKDFKITRERIREIEAKALRKIKKMRDDLPDDVA